MARDRRYDEDLRSRGIIVLRYWESDISNSPIMIAVMVAEVVLLSGNLSQSTGPGQCRDQWGMAARGPCGQASRPSRDEKG